MIRPRHGPGCVIAGRSLLVSWEVLAHYVSMYWVIGITTLLTETSCPHGFVIRSHLQVPVLPGSGLLTSAKEAGQLADGIGYPVLLKVMRQPINPI